MIDTNGVKINPATNMLDMNFGDTQVPKAANILRTQIGSLTYLPDFGIDIAYFLTSSVQFMNEGFKSYIVQRLAELGVSVDQIAQQDTNLILKYIVSVSKDEAADQYIV